MLAAVGNQSPAKSWMTQTYQMIEIIVSVIAEVTLHKTTQLQKIANHVCNWSAKDAICVMSWGRLTLPFAIMQ